MSSLAARAHRWIRPFAVVGLLAFVLFPWCYAIGDWENRFQNPASSLVAITFKTFGIAYLAIFLVIFVHECGHWFFGRLVGIRISDFVVGTGSSSVRFTWGSIRFAFGPWLSWGYVRELPSRNGLRFPRQLTFLAGGVVAEIIFLLALYLFPSAELLPASFEQAFDGLRRFAFVSGGIGICASVWPWMATVEGRPTPNDALRIRQAWKNRGKADELWRDIESSNEVNALADSGKYAEAATKLERMLQSDPRNTDRLQYLAALFVAGENWDGAMRTHYEVIQRTAPASQERVQAIDVAATLALQLGRRDDLVRLRPLVEQAMQIAALPTIAGTLGSILVELDDTVAGEKLLNDCLAQSEADSDRAIASAYLAKAALRMGRKERATELLGFAKAKGGDHSLVGRLVEELEPELQRAGVISPARAQQ